MKSTVSFYDFERAFADMGRKDQFTYSGLRVLFEHLEQMEEDTGTEIELDVIALCCEYYEDSACNIADNYRIDLTDLDRDADDWDDQVADAIREYLERHTMVCGETDAGDFVYQSF